MSSFGTGRERRICILGNHNPYARRSGSAAYVDHLARSLHLSGAEVHLRVLKGLGPGQLQAVPDPGFAAPYRSMAFRDAIGVAGRFFARDPGAWLGRLGGRPGPPPQGLWALPRPEPEAADWAAAEVARLDPDWVIANYFNAAEVFGRLAPGPSRAILLHDVFALRAESLAALGRPPDFDDAMLARETAAFRTADLLLAIKAEEAVHVARVAPDTEVTTLPFAVDIPDTDLTPPRPPVAVFVGGISQPNIDALDWLLGEIWPAVIRHRPDARLRVIGRVADRHDRPWPAGAERVGFVEDLAADYAGAAVVLAPIRFGSGVKIKLVEGLAHGLPGVATPVGAEGLAALPERVLRLAETAEDFAAALVAALADPDPAGARAAARAAAAAHYARDAVAARLAADLDRVRAAGWRA